MDKKKDEKDTDCSCYAKSRTDGACPPAHTITHPLRYYEFTQDEIRALEECDKESFYQRCLPFSALFGTLTYGSIKFGLLKKNYYFGAVPKVLLALLAGHVCGRLTYLPQCDEKFRELPDDSHLGNVMRGYHDEKNPPPPPQK